MRRILLAIALLVLSISGHRAAAQAPRETFATGHLVLVYRNGAVPANADAIAAEAGARSFRHIARFGVSALHIEGDEAAAIARLRARPEVAAVLHDRLVRGHMLFPVQPVLPVRPVAPILPILPINIGTPAPIVGRPLLPVLNPIPTPAPTPVPFPASAPDADSLYDSAQGWAVRTSGGFGDNIPGGPPTGPWSTNRGTGIRIAILDSGIDQNHPDLAPNLALNLTEVDQTALPSPCDDGSPQDQQGHGTFAASLAAAVIGGGELIGVAPQATLLNIKVLERTPAATGSTLTAQCEAGEANGLLSWVLLGLEDAVAHHANVVSLSLGTLVDTSTGDGAGWQAQFNAATYAAQQAGVVIVAALGNDGLNLGTGSLTELPAQARGVLPVVASTNPACAENLAENATCIAGPITRASYSNFGVAGAIAAAGGNYPQDSTTTGVTGFVRGACTSGLTNTIDGLPADGHSFGCFGVGHVQYVQAIGTSASAPLVAGAAAVLIAAYPNFGAQQIVDTLRSSATSSATMAEPRLNLAAALAYP